MEQRREKFFGDVQWPVGTNYSVRTGETLMGWTPPDGIWVALLHGSAVWAH